MLRLKSIFPLVVAALVGAATLGTPSEAQAGFAIKVNTGSGLTTYTDGDAEDMGPGGAGDILVFHEGLTIHATQSLSSSLSTLILHVTGDVSVENATTVLIQASLSDIPTGPPPQNLQYSGTGTVSVGTPSIKSWLDAGNGLFDGDPNDPDLATDSSTPLNSGLHNLGFSLTPNYALTTEIKVSLEAGASADLDLDSNNTITASAVPAPPALVLALTGLPGLGFGAWLRRRRSSTPE